MAMNIFTTIGLFIVAVIQICHATIVAKGIQTDYKEASCTVVSADTRSLIYYPLSDLLDNPTSYSYKALGLAMWYKYQYSSSSSIPYSFIFGLSQDYTMPLATQKSVLGYWISQPSGQLQFQSWVNNLGQLKAYSTISSSMNVWRKAIIVFQPNAQTGYMRDQDVSTTSSQDFTLDFTGISNKYWLHYVGNTQTVNNNVWLNLDHGIQDPTYTNSCSRQKYAMFFYSNDQAFTVQQIQSLYFDYFSQAGYTPVYYFPFKRNQDSQISDQTISFGRFKNLYMINSSEALNGGSLTSNSNDVSLILDGDVFITNFAPGQIITFTTYQTLYQMVISFVLEYNTITNGLNILSSDTNLIIQALTSSGTNILQVTYNGQNNQFSLPPSGSQLSFEISMITTTTTNISYYIGSVFQLSNTYNSNLLAISQFQIGTSTLPSDGNTSNDNFQIKDFFVIPNADIKQNSQYPSYESQFLLSNCDLIAQFDYTSAYCLVCSATYTYQYAGTCATPQSGQSTTQLIPYSNSFFGSNIISIVESQQDPQKQSLTYNYSRGDNNFNFLILGRYYVTQVSSGLFTTLAYLQVTTPHKYYFLHLYLQDSQNVVLKMTLDSANLFCSKTITYSSSILSQWMTFGFGYNNAATAAYLVYQDQTSNLVFNYVSFTCSSTAVQSTTTGFTVCLGCLLPNPKIYSQMTGLIKQVKMLEGFTDYTNLNQYNFYDSLIMETSGSNINYSKVTSLKSLFELSLPGLSFSCGSGYVFFEGFCVSSGSCPTLVRSSNILGTYNALYGDTTLNSCENCPQNCLSCTSSSVCTSCRVGYILDPAGSNLCISCASGTLYDPTSKSCLTVCPSLTDLSNQICATSQDLLIYNSLPLLSIQTFNQNDGFQILGADGNAQTDRYVSCSNDVPYQSFTFYGGQSVLSTFQLTKSWNQLPNGYQKTLSFYVVLYGSTSSSDLVVTMNGQTQTSTVFTIIKTDINVCSSNSSSQQITLAYVQYVVADNSNSLSLVIKFSKNGFAIRNVQLSLNKCHSSCYSCENGSQPWNCLSCSSKYNILVKTQCICQSNEYYKSQGCYSSPCYDCVQCTQSNCSRCQDETGLCLVCSTGYQLYQGTCVSTACTAQTNYAQYSTSNVCYLTQTQAFDQLQTNLIISDLEFWQETPNTISTNGWQLQSCLNQKLLPHQGNVGGTQGYFTFNMFLSLFQSNYQGFQFNFQLAIIDSMDLNADFLVFYSGTNQIVKQTFGMDSSGSNSCENSGWNDKFQSYSMPALYQNSGTLNMKIAGLFDEDIENESFSLGEVKANFILNAPLCTGYTFPSGNAAPTCNACGSNSTLNSSNVCVCNDGYYFYYNSSINDGQCVACNPACLKCTGPTVYSCNGCANLYFYDGTRCLYQCQEGFYKTSSNQCAACNSNCYGCSGPNSTQCTSCQTGMFLYNSQCYSSCTQANPALVANTWSRTCEKLREQQGTSLFSSESFFTTDIITFYQISNTYGSSFIFSCLTNSMLGVFPSTMSLVIQQISAHSVLQFSFSVYYNLGCANCQITVTIKEQQISSTQNANVAQSDCSATSVESYQFFLNDIQTSLEDYTFIISIPSTDFSISNIQLNTITCHPTCQYCVGTDINQCTSCFTGSSISGGNQIGQCTCNLPQTALGLTTNGCSNPAGCMACQQCPSPCSNCFKNDAMSCSSCISGYSLYLTSCVTNCPPGISVAQNDANQNPVCTPCTSPCLTCNQTFQCLTCVTGYLFVADTKQCVQICPTGYFQANATDTDCSNCDTSCASCSGTSNNCLTCSDGYYFYVDPVLGNQCLPCDVDCLTCTGPSNSNCIACQTSSEIISFQPSGSVKKYCTTTCEEVPGYFYGTDSSSNPLCQNCATNCSGCTSAAQDACTSCMIGYTLSLGSCSSCDLTCFSCGGTTAFDCTACLSPRALSNGQCLNGCPSGSFVQSEVTSSGTLNSCISCPTECSSCTSVSSCTGCQLGYYISNSKCLQCQNNCQVCYGDLGALCQQCNFGYYLQNKVCVSVCQNVQNVGYFGDISTRTCKQCDKSCYSCTNEQSYTCTACYPGTYLLSGTCVICPTGSKTCQYNATTLQVESLSCSTGYYLYSNQCIQSCPKGFYADSQSSSCMQCNIACKQCLDSTPNNCSSCSDGYVQDSPTSCLPCTNFLDSCLLCSSTTNCISCPSTKILYLGACVSSCDQSLGIYNQNMQCKPCVNPCAQCTSATACTSCVAGFNLNGSTCASCDIQCKTCNGPSSTNCTACNTGFYLQPTSQGQGTCQQSCNSGYYPNSSAGVCSQCDASCGQCTSGTDCTICNNGYYQQQGEKLCTQCKPTCTACTDQNTCQKCATGAFLSDNDCITSCPDGYFGQGGLCVPCDITCQTCITSSTQCASCSDGFYLSNGTCIACNSSCTACTSSSVCTSCISGQFLDGNSCSSSCSTPQTYADLIQYKCLTCDVSCKTCNGQSPKNCLTCSNGYYFSALNNSSTGTCIPCDSSCAQCTGPANTQCSSCQTGVQFQAPSTCVKCGQSQFYDGKQCSSCSNLCLTCFGPSQNNCLSCQNTYFLNGSTNTCTQCPPTCTICIDNTYCTQCKPGSFLLENSSCVTTCPPGMRGDINSGMCLCDVTCNTCKYNSVSNTTTCTKCINNQYLLNGNNAACMPYSSCTLYKDIINLACVSSCPPKTQYIDYDEKTCSNNPCKATQYLQTINKIQYCVSSCIGSSYYDSSENQCFSCNLKCQSCFGAKDSECTVCTDKNYYHPEITTCKDDCLPGYIQLDSTQKICTACKTNCKFCTESLLLYEGNCLSECPIGFEAVRQTCQYLPNARVQIANLTNNSTISINADFEITAILFSKSSVSEIKWEITESLDKTFLSDFSEISSKTLSQVIPYLILTASNKFVIQVTVTLSDGIEVSDRVSLLTPDVMKEGKFNVDKTSGQSLSTNFVFQINGWSYTDQLYFDLNFYELQGVQSFNNTNSSNTQLNFLKNNLFQLYENTTLNSTTVIVQQFQPFAEDKSLVCELKVYSQNQNALAYQYLMITLEKYKGVNPDYNYLQNQLNTITSNTDLTMVGDLLFSYTFTLNSMVSRNSTSVSNLKQQVNLRQTSALLGVSSSDLPNCTSSIDCFAQGSCVNNPLYKEICFCTSGFYGQNCEWNQNQQQIITNSINAINTLIATTTVSSIIKIQIIENMMTYFNLYYLSYNTLNNMISLYTNLLNSYLSASSIEQISGQILQRSLSTLVSTIKSMNQDPTTLINLGYTLQNGIASNLNVGEKLISSSTTNDSITYPFLIQTSSSTSSSRRMRRLKKKSRFLDNSSSPSSSTGVPITYGALSISFPPEVVVSNKKQIIQVSSWNQNPRSNPLSITQSISVSISSGGSVTPVSGLQQPIILTLPKSIPSPVSKDPSSITCTYYDEATNSFQSEGCTFVKETILNIICSCTHLTDFTAQMAQSTVNSSIKLSDITNTVISGNSELTQMAGSKVTINSLPPLKIGQKSVNLVNQLNILQSGSAVNLVKQNMIILEESDSYFNDQTEFWGEDQITLPSSNNNNDQNISQAESENKVLIIIYIFLVIFVFFFLSTRASIKFKFIDVSERKIRLFKEKYQKFLDEYAQPKEQVQRKGQKLQNYISFNSLNNSANSFEKRKTLKNAKHTLIQQQVISNIYENKQQHEKQQRQKSDSQSSLISIEDDIAQNKKQIVKQKPPTVISNQYAVNKKSSFSMSKAFSSTLESRNESKLPLTFTSEEEIDLSKSDSRGSHQELVANKEVPSRRQARQTTLKKYQTSEKLNTIVDDEDEDFYEEEEDEKEFYSSKLIQPKTPNKISSKFFRANKSEIEQMSYISIKKQPVTDKDKEYENHIQDHKEKQTHPRTQSIKNLKHATKLSNKLKRNQELLHEFQKKNSSSYDMMSFHNTLQEKKELVKQNLPQKQQTDMKESNISYLQLEANKIKQKRGYKFITSIQKQEETQRQLTKMQIQKSQIIESQTKMQDVGKQIYKIDEFGEIEFEQNDIKFNVKFEYVTSLNQLQSELDELMKQSKKRRYQSKENQMRAIQKKINIILLQLIDEQIESKKSYVQLIENIINQYLSIDSYSIFQFFSLAKYSEYLFSYRFTKCLYLYTQFLVATVVNIIYYSSLTYNFEIKTTFGTVYIYIFRIMVTFALSYSIPYFFFGCVNNIFAQNTRKIKALEELNIKFINNIRKKFLCSYLFTAAFQICVCFLGLFYYHYNQNINDYLSISYLIFEVVVSQLINCLIIDGIFFLIYTYGIKENKDCESGIIKNLIACRGFFYFRGYDNFDIYRQYYLAQMMDDI